MATSPNFGMLSYFSRIGVVLFFNSYEISRSAGGTKWSETGVTVQRGTEFRTAAAGSSETVYATSKFGDSPLGRRHLDCAGKGNKVRIVLTTSEELSYVTAEVCESR